MDAPNGKPQPGPSRYKNFFRFLGSAWSTLKPNSFGAFFATTVGASILVTSFAAYWNETEISRMARAVRQGLYFTPNIPEEKIDEKLLPVDLNLFYKKLEHPEYNSFVGLVGMKATGKSALLDKLGYKMISEKSSGVVKIKKLKAGPVHRDIYDHLRDGIFNLPGFWGWMRLRPMSSEQTVIKVFEKVQQQTGKPVTVLIDVSPQKHMKPIKAEVPVPGIFGTLQREINVNPSDVLPAIDAETFVREVKFFATDMKVMHCAFVASEGLDFQIQFEREPRLKLFLARELTMEKAKLVLAKQNQKVNEDHLKRIPRTFATLEDYANAADKDAYVSDSFARVKEKIRPLDTPYKNLIRKATKQPIGYTEIDSEKLSHSKVLDMLVAKNLFTLNERSAYEIQFEMVAEAIKEL